MRKSRYRNLFPEKLTMDMLYEVKQIVDIDRLLKEFVQSEIDSILEYSPFKDMELTCEDKQKLEIAVIKGIIEQLRTHLSELRR